MATKRTDLSPDVEASLVRALAYGVNSERLAPLDLQRSWAHEWWMWSVPEMEALFEKHRDAVLALARVAGLSRPWVLDAVDRDRARAAAAARGRAAD